MKYVKKPIVVEARQLTGKNLSNVAEWCDGWDWGDRLSIETLEGVMTAQLGDWIIKGVKGEFYPCKPDIFAATYEPVEKGEGL
jgi:hypothetical protein